MSNKEYEDLISRVITKKSKHPEVKGPKIEYGGAEYNGGTDFDISWFCASMPFAIHEGVHTTHDFDEFLCFASGNPHNMNEFQAKIEIELGEKNEKRLITEPTVLYLPKGFSHGKIIVKKVDKPFSYIKICLPKYSKNIPLTEIQLDKLFTKPSIKTRTIKEQYYIDKNLVREEKKHMQTLSYEGKDAGGVNFTMYWHVIKEPLVLYKPPHVHDYKQYELFYGGNPMNVNKFNSEIDIYLGEEAEKYLIDCTSIVHIKEGLVHRQVDFRIVDKPVYFINFFLSPECA